MTTKEHKKGTYYEGMNLYFQKPLHQRALLSIKEKRFWIGFRDWFDNHLMFYPISLYRIIAPNFTLDKKRYAYLISNIDVAATTERALEIPIALDFLKDYDPKIHKFLEVGNTLNVYCRPRLGHTVLDKYEVEKGVINQDIAEFKPKEKYDFIVSISTMEHVGFDESPQDPKKIRRSMDNIESLMNPGCRLLVTVPVGFNPVMDDFLKKTKLKKNFMVKTSLLNDWKEVEESEAFKHPWGSRFKGDNAIAILRNV